MAKVYGSHRIELNPGVDEKEYERFFANELVPVYQRLPGVNAHLFKGDRGERTGKYLAVMAIESVERRDQLFPSAEQQSEEAQQWMSDNAAVIEKAGKYSHSGPDPLFTDYVNIVSSDSTGTVYGLHRIELNPGVNEQEFERFFADEFAPLHQSLPGMWFILQKGDRGERAGKYVFVVEIESVERRDQLLPASGQPSEEFQQWMASAATIMEKAGKYGFNMDPLFTDYVVVR